jgi:hypothetical protein
VYLIFFGFFIVLLNQKMPFKKVFDSAKLYFLPATSTFIYLSLDIMVEWIDRLLCIEKALDSYLSSQTTQPNLSFSWFFSVPPCEHQDSTSNYAMATSFHQIHYSLIIMKYDATAHNLSTCWLHSPFKDEAYLFYKGLSAYRAVNTLHFSYKNLSLNVL